MTKSIDQTRPLILASTSRYRAQLLERLGLPFRALAPEVDESPQPGEAASQLASRLATAKARALASDHPGAVLIGSDQVAALGQQVLGKPGTRSRAQQMLRQASGQAVDFFTAVAVESGNSTDLHVDHTRARFRTLSEEEIQRYVERDQPMDCAGAFKCESLGIALFSEIENRDPTALVGLPLIALAGMLRRQGFVLP